MSEVKRYFMGSVEMVPAENFDRVTAELASANSDKEAYAQNAIDLRKRVDALQALLTAADERADHNARVSAIAVEDVLLLQKRADVLETALAGMLFAFDDGVGLDWSEDLLDFARKLVAAKEFRAALKPAEGAKCKACGGRGSVCVDWDSGAWSDCQECTKP